MTSLTSELEMWTPRGSLEKQMMWQMNQNRQCHGATFPNIMTAAIMKRIEAVMKVVGIAAVLGTAEGLKELVTVPTNDEMRKIAESTSSDGRTNNDKCSGGNMTWCAFSEPCHENDEILCSNE